jgi:hypothetical protein
MPAQSVRLLFKVLICRSTGGTHKDKSDSEYRRNKDHVYYNIDLVCVVGAILKIVSKRRELCRRYRLT